MKQNQLGRRVLYSLALSFFAISSHAQWFHLPGFLQSYEIGYNYSIANATYKSQNQWNDGSHKLDTTLSQNVTSTSGIGGQIGFTFPVKRIGGKCMLAIGAGYQYNMYTWDYKTPSLANLNGDGYADFNYYTSVSGVSLQMGLPLSADFKFGNDAFRNKNVRWGCTFGAGVLPVAALTADFDNAGFGFGAAPFVKAEVSFFAGICWKARAQYAAGYLPFYDAKNSLGGFTDYNVKSSLIGKQQITFSLILMPFSWAWQERGWWNSY